VNLRQIIARKIDERGPIPFSRYMDLCLYDPELGYYSRHAQQFGKAGDFYTSSDVHAVFGRLLARQFEEMWRLFGSPARMEILELGPGRGLLARDVLDWSEKKFPEFFHALHYSLEERSAALQARLKETLSQFLARGIASLITESASAGHIPQGLKPWFPDPSGGTAKAVPFHNDPPSDVAASSDDAADGFHITTAKTRECTTLVVPDNFLIRRALAPEVPLIIIANEFFDALPVEIVSTQGSLRISVQDDRFIETWASPSVEELEFLDRYSVHPEPGERIELPLQAHRYMARLGASTRKGLIVAVDYGYTRQEQLAGRHRGTLMAYRQHSASPNPYEAPGEQDLTAHLNFTALEAAAEENGMQAQPLLTQSQFLMGIGEENQFADAFEDSRLPQERAKVALQLKHLVTPAGVGESFHVLIASKGVATEHVAALSGLSFARSKL
jgi:SAM-dependent MidA family methyltransferase